MADFGTKQNNAGFFWGHFEKNSGFREKTQIFSPETPVFRNFEKKKLVNKHRKNSAQTPKNSGQMAKNSAFGIFLNFEIFEKVPKKKACLIN